VKYLVLIYSNPQNWGHPAFARTAEFAAMPQWDRETTDAEFEGCSPRFGKAGNSSTATL